MNKEDEFIATAWNTISDAFQKRYMIKVSPIVYAPFGPTENEINLLGEKKGKKIIDIGAGGCQKAIYLAQKGSQVTAFDISNKQISYGKKIAKREKTKITFVRGDYQNIDLYFNAESFDTAYSIFALQYCRNILALSKVFKKINKILKQNGVFVFSIDHPCRRGYWNENNEFIFDNYFDRKENQWDYSFPEYGTKGRFRGKCWTLSDMINAFISAGFKVDKIIEPTPIKRRVEYDKFGIKSRYGKLSKKDVFLFEHLQRVPGTIIIKGVKL